MPTINHKLMLAVDWLSLSLLSMEPLRSEVLETKFSAGSISEPSIVREAVTPADYGRWDWRARKYGTKQFKTIWDISIVDDEGVCEPFGTLCAEPTTIKVDPCLCTLKLDNHILYRRGAKLWVDVLRDFLADYWLRIMSISRCDLACDFLFLRGRVSGPQLIEKLKTFQWWKCGSVKVSEHYVMPYQIAKSSWEDNDSDAPRIFLQHKKMAAHVETMTFGTMSSDAQVCIYDKTLELKRTEVRAADVEGAATESAKEYIRDCHKEAGVYDKKSHTWRIEIRLRNKALFMVDTLRCQERPLELADLEPLRLYETFKAACSKYFRLVDASMGGQQEITPEYCRTMASHKNRLPEVELFNSKAAHVVFTKKPFKEPANKFHRAVIRRLDELGDRINRVPCRYTKPEDKELLPKVIARLGAMSKKMRHSRSKLLKALHALEEVDAFMASGDGVCSSEDAVLVSQAKELLERHYRTESPQFCRNIASMLSKYAAKMKQIDEVGTDKAVRRFRSAAPEDSAILLEAADIIKAIYIDVVYDERRVADEAAHEKGLREAIAVINSMVEPPPAILDYAYQVIETSLYLSSERVRAVVEEQQSTDFYQLIRCNWNLALYHRLLHHAGEHPEWIPPVLPKFQTRCLTKILQSL